MSKNIQVCSMEGRSGKPVLNQFIISINNIIYYQSYDSIIARKENGSIYLDPDYYNYSVTTKKYLLRFLGIENKIFKDNLKNNVYIFEKMN